LFEEILHLSGVINLPAQPLRLGVELIQQGESLNIALRNAALLSLGVISPVCIIGCIENPYIQNAAQRLTLVKACRLIFVQLSSVEDTPLPTYFPLSADAYSVGWLLAGFPLMPA